MAVLEQIRRYRYRALKTLILFSLMMINGMMSSLPGVTLLDLQIAVDVPLDKITLILPSCSIGFIVGAIACGILVEYIDYQILMMIASLLCTFSVAALPWNRGFIDICINSGINGLLCGFVNSGGNTWILYIWGKESPSFMQAYHFSFGVGAFIAPLVAAPYLLPLQDIADIADNSTFVASNATSLASNKLYTPEDVNLVYPYSYVAILNLLLTVAFIIVYCIHSNKTPHPTYSKKDAEDGKSSISPTLKIVIISITCTFMLFYYGLELSFGQLLTAFVVNCDLKLDKATASYMTSLYWATFTFFRCFVIFIVDICSCQTLLIFCLSLVMASNAILWPFANSSQLLLWIAVALMGFGTSPIFACVFGFGQEIVRITSKIASLLYVSCSLGTFIFPYLMGAYMDTDPNVFIYTSFACGAMCSLTFASLLAIKYIYIVNNNRDQNQNKSCIKNDSMLKECESKSKSTETRY